MAVDVSPALSWKNKRKKSLYAEEADMGFIFRKVHKPAVEPKVVESIPNGVIQPLLVNGTHEPQPVLMNGYGGGGELDSVEEEAMMSQDTTETSISFDASLLDVGDPELEKELHKKVELKRFIAQLKKELLSVDEASSEEVDKVLDGIGEELKESGLYFKYMEANGPDELLPHPLTEQLKDHISKLKASTEMYKRELKEWEELLEKKKAEVEQAKRNCESNKKINYSNIRSEDVAALKTYLTPEQLSLLNHPAPVDQMFMQQATSRLQQINAGMDREVSETRVNCHQMIQWMKSSIPGGASTSEETPRTLFKSLKKGLA